jgi:hypothetical protein
MACAHPLGVLAKESGAPGLSRSGTPSTVSVLTAVESVKASTFCVCTRTPAAVRTASIEAGAFPVTASSRTQYAVRTSLAKRTWSGSRLRRNFASHQWGPAVGKVQALWRRAEPR